MSPITKGNRKADQKARKAAQRPVTELALFPSVDNADLKPDYMSEEKSWAIEKFIPPRNFSFRRPLSGRF